MYVAHELVPPTPHVTQPLLTLAGLSIASKGTKISKEITTIEARPFIRPSFGARRQTPLCQFSVPIGPLRALSDSAMRHPSLTLSPASLRQPNPLFLPGDST